MISAQFFDGKTPKAKAADVRVLGSLLVITERESKNEFTIELSKLDVTRHGDVIILSDAHMEVHMAKSVYPQLKHNQGFLGKDETPVIQGILIAATIVVTIYLFYRPMMNLAVGMVPDSFFESTSKQLVEHYKPQHCLSKEQENHLADIFSRLGKNYSSYKVFVVKSKLVNAFVMPGKVMVIHDELIKTSSSPEAIAGIMSHEMAHIEGEHAKIGYIKHYLVETFFSFVFDGNAANGIMKVVTQSLFTQEEEREADLVAARELKAQQIDPQGMVTFFEQLQKEESSYLKFLVFTHPDYHQRISMFKQVYDTYPVLSPKAWTELKAGCK